jgi:hypothetical protein
VPSATAATPDAKEIVDSAGIRFTVASRPQRRFSASQTVSNFAGATSFQPIQLPATGFVRKLALFFTATFTTSASAAVVAGDAPFNLISAITLTDATGQPVTQPISGYSLYLVNKYLPTGDVNTNIPRAYNNPQLGPEFAYSASSTSGSATFRLDLELEQDYNTGYGSIPNLDSNASLQLKIDVAAYTVAFGGGTPSAATVSVRVSQYYWAPVGQQLNGQAVDTDPVGFGDYIETRFETQTVTASAENLVQITNRGGLVKGLIVVSRAAGVRTAITAATPFGLILDNNPIDEGVLLEEHQDYMRRIYGYFGTDLTTSYAPLTAGVAPGIDRGVLCHNFAAYSGGRDSWLATRVGSLLQLRLTPGASATTLEIITQLGQIRRPEAFYAKSALD